MKVNIILVDECGEEIIAETINGTQIAALGNCLDGYIELRIGQIYQDYPECRGVYREDIKSPAEEAAEQYEAIYEEELAWALEHEEELEEDPYEYATEMAESYFRNSWW